MSRFLPLRTDPIAGYRFGDGWLALLARAALVALSLLALVFSIKTYRTVSGAGRKGTDSAAPAVPACGNRPSGEGSLVRMYHVRVTHTVPGATTLETSDAARELVGDVAAGRVRTAVFGSGVYSASVPSSTGGAALVLALHPLNPSGDSPASGPASSTPARHVPEIFAFGSADAASAAVPLGEHTVIAY